MPKKPKREFKKSGIAPVVEPDIHELGDKRLNPEEGVAREREALLHKVSAFRIPGQDELENPDRQYGPRISAEKFIVVLQHLAPGLVAKETRLPEKWATPGAEGEFALYYPRTTDELDEVLREGGSTDTFFIFNKYVGGMPRTELPEFGYVDIDTSRIATREHIRSWRTVLIQLMKAGVISYRQAIDAFGEPLTDARSRRWFLETETWRKAPERAFTRRDIA